MSESIAEEAQRLTTGDRRASYCHPLDDFTMTGKLWAVILGLDTVTPEQVGLCMAAVKISREARVHLRDNLVDLAGYANTVQMVHEERERRATPDEVEISRHDRATSEPREGHLPGCFPLEAVSSTLPQAGFGV